MRSKKTRGNGNGQPEAHSKRTPDALQYGGLTEDLVRARAHLIYLSRVASNVAGDADSDWHCAEEQVRAELLRAD